MERPEQIQPALWRYLVDENLAADSFHLAREQVAPRPRSAHREQSSAGYEGPRQARQARLADAQSLLELAAARVAAQAAQDLEKWGVGGGRVCHCAGVESMSVPRLSLSLQSIRQAAKMLGDTAVTRD